MMSQVLLLGFGLFTTIASFFVISVLNPVYSVLFLVLVFLGVSAMFFLLQLDFIPLCFIIVYVGAIAILFLFVVMMLDLKVTSTVNNFFKYLPMTTIICCSLFFTFFFRLSNDFNNPNFSENSCLLPTFWFSNVNNFSNIDILGCVLYTNFFIFLLISGIVLLVAMIGAISLTLKYNKDIKNQFVFRQLSRKALNALFLIQN